MTQTLRILLLEDRASDAQLEIRHLEKEGLRFVAKHVQSEGEFLTHLREFAPDIILADYALPGYTGLAALAATRGAGLDIPFILVSGTLAEDQAVNALHQGATDFVVKDRLSRLGPAVSRALRERDERRQRREAELRRREADQRYRVIFEQSPFGVVVIDPATARLIEFNEASHRQLGYSRDEFAALSLTDIAVQETPDQVRLHLEHLMRAGTISFETRHRTRSGEARNVHVTAQVLRWAGQPVVHGIWWDVTERRRAEFHLACLSEMGTRLSAAQTPREAAEIIVEAADKLFGWDACEFSTYTASTSRFVEVLVKDTIAGERREFPNCPAPLPPSQMMREVVEQGPKLILKSTLEPVAGAMPFGAQDRASASIMIVPIRNAGIMIGAVGIHSYTFQAYSPENLVELEKLAGQCGGALARIQAEEALRNSLREKEALLKEVHHRVKNNLQLMSSLLHLQEMQIESVMARAILQDTQARIRSMALLHEALYRSGSLDRVDLAQYIESLVAYLRHTIPGSVEVDICLDLAKVQLDLDLAVPCGLIINELVTNSLKHAFPRKGSGRVSVETRAFGDREILLRVSDNGVGLPADLSLSKPRSLGMQLVNDLVQQIGGHLEIRRESGTAFAIQFQLTGDS